MATILAPSVHDTPYSGDSPAAFSHGKVTLESAQIGDKVRLATLFAGSVVYDAKIVTAALGASTTIKLGFEYANGEAGGNDAAFLPASPTASAGVHRSASAPVKLAHDAYVIATVGGAAATGLLESVVSFEHRGTM